MHLALVAQQGSEHKVTLYADGEEVDSVLTAGRFTLPMSSIGASPQYRGKGGSFNGKLAQVDNCILVLCNVGRNATTCTCCVVHAMIAQRRPLR